MIYIGECELACFVYLCHHPRSQFTKLFTQALFIGPYHCPYVFVPCQAFCVRVAGDLNKIISFVVGVLSTSLALYLGSSIRARTALCKHFQKYNSYQTKCFWKQWVCLEQWWANCGSRAACESPTWFVRPF